MALQMYGFIWNYQTKVINNGIFFLLITLLVWVLDIWIINC